MISLRQAADLEQLYGDLELAGHSPSVRHAIHLILYGALRVAERRGHVQRNIAALVDPPRYSRPRMDYCDVEQARKLLAAAAKTRWYALYLLAITTGMRQGEIFALTWDCIDLDASTVSVRGTLTRDEKTKKLVVTDTKTPKSRRLIALGADVVRALREHREKQPAGAEFVFCTQSGAAIDKDNFRDREFYTLLRTAGLPRIRFHGLRHTAATLPLAQNIHPSVVAERLGHANPSITLDIYSHVLPGLQRQAAAVLDKVLR